VIETLEKSLHFWAFWFLILVFHEISEVKKMVGKHEPGTLALLKRRNLQPCFDWRNFSKK
jgi:hypothetical protein